MQFKIVIPARYQSSRLPGKPLVDILGKPMIQHVYERASESLAEQVIIATDDGRVEQTARDFGAEVCMTSSEHRSGTDRLAEVAQQYRFNDDDIIVNVQGDEPTLPATLINQVAEDLAQHQQADIATLYRTISEQKQIFDPNVVKVVMDSDGYALYFSRAPMPWVRDQFYADFNLTSQLSEDWQHYRHIGLYAYRASFLTTYTELSPCQLEWAESLEQLRALYHGKRIHLSACDIDPGHGIDTPADLEQIKQQWSQ